MSIRDELTALAQRSRGASRILLRVDSEAKDRLIRKVAARLREERNRILEANRIDLESSRKQGRGKAFLDRLMLNEDRLHKVARALEEIAGLRDPVGEIVSQWRRPGGFEVGQMRVPLGVVCIVYESRPNVTAEAAALCFKAGNATILRGGSEALQSNLAIVSTIRSVLEGEQLPVDAVQIVETPDREAVGILLKLNQWIDVIIPRGGKTLIERVVQESTIPVIKHYEGLCHVYIHKDADPEMAVAVAINAKVQRPGTCNAAETILIDAASPRELVSRLASELRRHGVRIHGCPLTATQIEVDKVADDADYRTEYLDLICNIRIVRDLEDAIQHISEYGSRHTDAIVTGSYEAARRFIREVDASSVMVNASTRLADGGVYGLGAEIGISTDKLHAYGPMGVNELTTKKFVVFGQGALRT